MAFKRRWFSNLRKAYHTSSLKPLWPRSTTKAERVRAAKIQDWFAGTETAGGGPRREASKPTVPKTAGSGEIKPFDVYEAKLLQAKGRKGSNKVFQRALRAANKVLNTEFPNLKFGAVDWALMNPRKQALKLNEIYLAAQGG